MAIDVDWPGTATNPYRIFIPRADMPIVQISPEIRELDLDVFRKELRSVEAAEPGAPWPETHQHVTETTLSGTVYARIVRITPPYTVEFEDGQYAVRAVGANHNILDVKVANQVSLLVQNSAGLINSPTIDAIAATMTTVEADVAVIQVETLLIRKVVFNRLEVNVSTQELVMYDDDGTTILHRWPLATTGGEPVQTTMGIQTKRGPPL